MAMLKGIDVSRWQGVINWDAVKADGQRFAMIKIGGSDDGLYPDGYAARNAAEARRVGLARGFYVYLGGVHTVAEEVQHVKNLVANIGGLQPGECLCLDWEEHTANEVDYVTGIAKGLVDAGFPPPLVYMSLSRVKSQDWSRVVSVNSGLWVAAWGNNDALPQSEETPGSDEWPFWALWQFSSTGTVAGIAGRVDLDMLNSDDIAVFAKYGATGNANVSPAPVPTPAPAPQAVQTYTVQPGDNLTVIGQHYGVSWQAIFALNTDRISNPSKIFVGQALRVPAGPSGVATPPPAPRTYTVAPGDSLSKIAATVGTSWQTLYAINQSVIGPNANFIKVGQVLRLP